MINSFILDLERSIIYISFIEIINIQNCTILQPNIRATTIQIEWPSILEMFKIVVTKEFLNVFIFPIYLSHTPFPFHSVAALFSSPLPVVRRLVR